MSKKDNAMKNNISNLGKGVLEIFEENESSRENSISKEETNKPVKDTKSKRSFMLTDTAIQKLNLLKLCSTDLDLSTIVEESINLYFEKNKGSIEDLINIYDKIK